MARFVFLSLLFLFLFLIDGSKSQLHVGFYSNTCPQVESTVHDVVREAVLFDRTKAAVLLRLHFHDCFVEGCDGSILINTTQNPEKTAFPHAGVKGFEVIERAKAQLEASCPGVVSCADIVALAARDAIVMANGPAYQVPTGRRDGFVSDKSLAGNMPDVNDSIQQLKTKFLNKGLTEKDLVLLSELKARCPKDGDVNIRLAMDEGSDLKFDKSILKNIREGFAVLASDARLNDDFVTKSVIDSYFNPINPTFGPSFENDFVQSMVKMGQIGVKTGSVGNIRRVCSAFN
ncbi:peroxidase 43 isoform X2 [Medicago truncatula]|uniref:Peroxidase n=1 Tax=Medicago truncatula TaxID=3880 RepID=G7IL98_MEDTR|nr:peroxidase 43 isoform X2 [Medicago truncatula]AES63387.1 class III peroxidase [Medicago truncatula]